MQHLTTQNPKAEEKLSIAAWHTEKPAKKNVNQYLCISIQMQNIKFLQKIPNIPLHVSSSHHDEIIMR